MTNSLVGKTVKIVADLGLEKFNQEGCVVKQDGNIVYVTNLNMPFCGTLVNKPFTLNEIEVK